MIKYSRAVAAPREAWFKRGSERWPSIRLAPEAFASYCADLTAADDDRAEDLFLACACAERDEGAQRLFAEAFTPEIDRVAARASAPGISPEDARQMLLERILVGTGGAPAKIAKYEGRGSLRGWVRVTAVRLLIDIFRSGGRGREVRLEDTMLDEITGSDDPEITYLKSHYRAQFNAAFEAAVATLCPRDRNHLRHLFVERLTIDQLAALYGVHRSTAARRLTSARDALLAATRAKLVEQLQVDGSEINSIMRLIGSRIELSVQRIFGEQSA